MKASILLSSVALFMIFGAPVQAKDITKQFNEACAERGYGERYCNCTLKKLSKRFRVMDTRNHPTEKRNYESTLAIITKDPAVDKAKADAVCDLHDQAKVLEVKAAKVGATSAEKSAFTKEKLRLMQEKENLALSYGAGNEALQNLLHGHCVSRANYERIKLNVARDKGGIYPGLVDKMETTGNFSSLITLGSKLRCE